VHLHRDLLYTCETYARHVLAITAEDVTFSTTKLFHAYGLGNSLSFPYWAGATTALLSGRPTPDALFSAVERSRPTLFFSVPTLYNAMLAADEAGDFSSVRLCISAAEPLPADVWQRWLNVHDLVILDGIGSTEMLHIYCSNTADDVTPGSSGRPVPGYEVKLIDDNGEVLEGPGTGDLYVRGHSMLREYWNQPEKTADCIRDGWFYTRDRYRQDAQGRYWYEGRADDMFKVSGLWVSPVDVEARLIEHPAVLEAAVVGVQVEGFTTAKAYVALHRPKPADDRLTDELREFCAAGMHRYQVPQLIEFIESLPKTATGKIERYKLRERS
jgi:benzoate-CoA ligase family protein